MDPSRPQCVRNKILAFPSAGWTFLPTAGDNATLVIMSRATKGIWPVYQLAVRDDNLGIELPIFVIPDEPMSFEPQDGMELSEEQQDEIVQKICSQEYHAPIGVTETFGMLREYLSEMMLRGAGDGDDEEAARLGRLFAISSYFDAGVDFLLQYWTNVVDAAQKRLRQERGDNDLEMEPHEALTEKSIAACVKDLLGPDLKLMIRKQDDVERLAEITALRSLHYLNLGQACQLLNISDTTLRNDGWLHDLNKSDFDENKLNGNKLAGPRSAWRFGQDEVERFAQVLSRSGWCSITPRTSSIQSATAANSPHSGK